MEQNAELILDCIGHEISVLCDESYLKSLCKSKSDAREIYVLHKDICQQLGVDRIMFCTTWCVFNAIKSRHDDAVRERPNRIKRTAAVKNYALGVPLICDHVKNPINSWDCLKEILKSEICRPYVFASLKWRRLNIVTKRYGLPALSKMDEKLTVLPLHKRQKNKLKAIKARRIACLEKEAERKKEQEEKEKEREKELEKAENEWMAKTGEEYVSKRQRLKKKRTRKRKRAKVTDLYIKEYKASLAAEGSKQHGAGGTRVIA